MSVRVCAEWGSSWLECSTKVHDAMYCIEMIDGETLAKLILYCSAQSVYIQSKYVINGKSRSDWNVLPVSLLRQLRALRCLIDDITAPKLKSPSAGSTLREPLVKANSESSSSRPMTRGAAVKAYSASAPSRLLKRR